MPSISRLPKTNAAGRKKCWMMRKLVIVIAYGTTSRIVRSAMRKCREQGLRVGMLRPITLMAISKRSASAKPLAAAKHYLTVEMSTGQMVDDVRLAVNGDRPCAFLRAYRRHGSHRCRCRFGTNRQNILQHLSEKHFFEETSLEQCHRREHSKPLPNAVDQILKAHQDQTAQR